MTDGFVTEIDQQAAAAAEEAAAGGNGSFPPLPAGKYQAFVNGIEGVQDFGGTGDNAKKKVVKLKLKINDQSPTGKSRIFFVRVPLFSRYAPNAKHPQGAPAKAFWDFWEKAMGVSRDHILSGQPMPSNIGGKPLTITLGAPLVPDNYNPLGYNEVEFYDAAGSLEGTPRRAPGQPVAPWLDAHDNLLTGFQPTAPGQPAAAQAPSAPPQWGQPAAAAPAAPPAWGQPAAAPAAPAGPPAWTQQQAAPPAPAAPGWAVTPQEAQQAFPPADPSLQAAAQQSGGF